jgi:hypothetical protein
MGALSPYHPDGSSLRAAIAMAIEGMNLVLKTYSSAPEWERSPRVLGRALGALQPSWGPFREQAARAWDATFASERAWELHEQAQEAESARYEKAARASLADARAQVSALWGRYESLWATLAEAWVTRRRFDRNGPLAQVLRAHVERRSYAQLLQDGPTPLV